jgi:hypothetical protein
MADTFSRDSLATYEKNPQTKVSDKVNPFRGATPAQAASAAAVAAVAAGQVDATPGGAPQTAVDSDPLTDDSPVVDEDGTLGDPTDSGEGTSDVNSEDSSDSAVDPSDETDPNADLTGDAPPEEEVDARPAPKKGSAAERIVEALDLAEGYKVFGKTMQEQLLAANAELTRLRGGAHAAPAVVAPPVVENAPMPDMSDEDVGYDNDKYRAKMQKWLDARDERVVERAKRVITGADAAQKVQQSVEAKIEAYAKDHPDFKKTVTENETLRDNQLSPDAGFAVAKSEFTAELLHKFGKDTAFAIKVARMSPAEQLLTVGEMIADIKAEKKASKVPTGKGPANPQGGAKPTQKKSITQAPPPPRQTTGSGRAMARDQLDPAMDMNEFARQHRQGKQNARAENRKGRGLN